MKRMSPWMLAMPAVVLAFATGCSSPAGGSGSLPASTGTSTGTENITLDSCGRSVEFDKAPSSVLAVGSEAPSLLMAAGAGDKLTHYAGSLNVPFDEQTRAIVENAERITEDSHDVSYEMILNSGADVVIGTDIAAGVDLNSLAERLESAGVKMLTVSGYCAGFEDRSTGGLSGFEQIYKDVESYGQLFGTEEMAKESVDQMRDRVAAAARGIKGQDGQRGLPLYVPTSGSLGSYGHESLIDEQLDLLGMQNVFSDVPKRYFEPSNEELVSSAADKLFAMYLPTGSSGLETDQQVLDEVRQRAELKGLPALQDKDAIVPLNYYYSSPGPLAVDGVEIMAKQLAQR
ncbi:ABC transporter substrate-binding protein [Glutamicibacter halophytocola]|uniref:ABC transporter substrate-binding protein n=1 Tax=Glutamicibacter halophytocola TaxID=1933880 RepID=A0ABX5YDV5_9MICC|nr:ABC transporter substrate-binding protein [Glutamicibacter halophytocola]NQD40336.1 ABC transporter substrate-binding protein [Glutamicibacter halophytocola]QDY67839.1 ABC transporter substrate-binding protein [Glutamicibacter halophytocola]